MLGQTLRLLFFSHDIAFADPLGRALGPEFQVDTSSQLDPHQIGEIRERHDAVLFDLRANAITDSAAALRLISEIANNPLTPPVIALCDEGNRNLILSAIQHGAYDTVTHPPNMMELRLVLHRAHRFQAAEQEVGRLKAGAQSPGRLHELLGTSRPMQELFALAQKIAPCDVNVLITGETGTGKELLARAIHQLSSRSARQLVAFSCANLPETLTEDELFGHERGAFTGAIGLRRGRIEIADRSTLFLDEIGDLGLGLQPKLLRVLQERRFERLGGNNTVEVNIRLISATHRNLSDLVSEGKFREDLFYRLNVVQMHLPPLRDRRDDIPVLANHFLQTWAEQFRKKAKRFSEGALQAIEDYAWPGNVRELQNAVQRAVVLSEGTTVNLELLPAGMRSCYESPQIARSYEQEVREFKRRIVLRTLRKCAWRKSETARTLGVARGYLHRLMNQLDIQQIQEDENFTEAQAETPGVARIM